MESPRYSQSDEPMRELSPPPVIDSNQVEVAVLGAMLIERGAVAKALGLLREPTFATDQNRKVFGAMRRLFERGEAIDVVTLADELKKTGELESAGGIDHVGSLVHVVPTAAHIEHHARIIRERAQQRELAQIGRAITSAAEAGKDPSAILEAHGGQLRNLGDVGFGAFPAPESIRSILETPTLDDGWIAEGIIPRGGNVLVVGYPKSMKTTGYSALAVAAVLGESWFGRFPTHRQHRVGIVLMEGRRHHFAHKVARLAKAHGCTPENLEGRLHVWHRPPLRLTDPRAVAALAHWAEQLELDVLIVDAWGYVAGSGTNSNRDDEVLEQLQAFSSTRDQVPGLTTMLVHHTRKEQPDGAGKRLTDLIRGSGAFGQWFDAGLVFYRKDEQSPVSVRTEFRERPAMQTFAFVAEDEEAPSSSNEWTGQGWFKLRAVDETAAELARETRVEQVASEVRTFLKANPGAGVRAIRKGVSGGNSDIDTALELMERRKEMEVKQEGQKRCHYLVGEYA